MATQAERTSLMRTRLVAAARELFAAQGYAAASTEGILAKAGVTRGALYHHFDDKAALFRAVCEGLHEELVLRIHEAAGATADPIEALERGCLAYVEFMLPPEINQILVVDAPTVLGWSEWNRLDEAHGFGLLLQGVREAVSAGRLATVEPEAFAWLLNGAVNYAALKARSETGPITLEGLRRALRELIGRYATEPEREARAGGNVRASGHR